MPAKAMVSASTLIQSARLWPFTWGRTIGARTRAAKDIRSATVPKAPTWGMRVAAKAPPNCTERMAMNTKIAPRTNATITPWLLNPHSGRPANLRGRWVPDILQE